MRTVAHGCPAAGPRLVHAAIVGNLRRIDVKKLLIAVSLLLFCVTSIDAQTPFFQGKTVRIVTGFPAGDVNDLWPRLIGQYMTKYIPGNPTFIVQNMAGASSMIAANHVYGVAKPDVLTL